METPTHVRPRLVAEHLRPDRRARRRRAGGHQAASSSNASISSRRSAGDWSRCRSGSICRTGSRTPTSTSTSTCAITPCRRRATPSSSAEVVSRIVARPLDRGRPLWELYVIEGVDNGRLIAQLTKVHHATIDGAAGASMLAAILDADPDFRPVGRAGPWVPDQVPSDEELLRITLREYMRRPEKLVRLSVRTRSASWPRRRSRAGCARWPTWSPSRCRARSATLMRDRLRSAVRHRRRSRTGAAADAGTAHTVEPADHAAPPLRLHDGLARRCQDRSTRSSAARSTTS